MSGVATLKQTECGLSSAGVSVKVPEKPYNISSTNWCFPKGKFLDSFLDLERLVHFECLACETSVRQKSDINVKQPQMYFIEKVSIVVLKSFIYHLVLTFL